MKFKRAIVTGGLGFIGVRLCKQLLSEGVEVSIIDNHLFGRRFRELPDHPKLRIFNIDIRNEIEVNRVFDEVRPQAVFHLAAIAFIPKCIQDPGTAVAVHLDGTLNILRAAKKSKVKHLHFASSAAVYSPKHILLSEFATPIAPPPDVYGITKYSGELMCQKFAEETGAHVVITRFFNVYGPGRTNLFLIPSICEQLKSGVKTLELGNLDVERDYVYVDDVVSATLVLMEKTKGVAIANVGSGERTSLKGLVQLCEKIVGSKIKVVSKEEFRRDLAYDRPAWQADLRNIQKMTKWQPKVSLKDGLSVLINNL